MRTRLEFAALFVCAACGGGSTSDEIKIDSVEPAFGPLGGGTRVVLKGTGFLRDSAAPDRVLIGGNEAPLAGAVNDTELEVEVPPSDKAGDAEVIVINHNGYGKAMGVFHYSTAPTINSVTPSDVVYSSTSTNMTITGSGFKEEDAGFLRVLVDGTPAVDVMVASDTQLSFTALPGQALSSPDITIEDNRGQVVKPHAFRYTPGPRGGLLLFPNFSPTVFAVFFDPVDQSVVTVPYAKDQTGVSAGYHAVVQDTDGTYYGERRDSRWGPISLKTQVLPDDAIGLIGNFPAIARVGSTAYALQRSPGQFGSMDLKKGTFTRIGTTNFPGPGSRCGWGLAADMNGNLWAAVPNTVPITPQPKLGIINTTTGQLGATVNLPAGTHISDMRFLGTTLYVITHDGDLITVNTSTGAVSSPPVHAFGTNFGAMEVYQ